MTIIKPIPRKRELLDYNDVMDFIKLKYNINPDDYSNCFGENGNKDAPFQCFWHLICDSCSNGGVYQLDLTGTYPKFPDWAKEILLLIDKEFGEYASGEFLTLETNW